MSVNPFPAPATDFPSHLRSKCQVVHPGRTSPAPDHGKCIRELRFFDRSHPPVSLRTASIYRQHRARSRGNVCVQTFVRLLTIPVHSDVDKERLLWMGDTWFIYRFFRDSAVYHLVYTVGPRHTPSPSLSYLIFSSNPVR